MLSDKEKKSRKLSHEILGFFAVCLAVTLFLYFFLFFFGRAVAENYCWQQEITLDEEQLYHLDSVVFSVSLAVSVVFFVVLFLVLFGERMSYIGTIIKGVDALRRGELGHRLPLQGNNELTQLAREINYLSETEQAIKEKERALREEKEELIRTLSHDIRTPLTSIMSYTELLSAKQSCTPEEQREYLAMVGRKAGQIKNLTDILLDGGKRQLEHFEDARLLLEQLAAEFEETLEDDYQLLIDISDGPAFSGNFDVQEMRRIFDNLISNIQKYAEPAKAVELIICKNEEGIVIRQKNAVKRRTEHAESYRMGLYSIRRIAHNYGGAVEVLRDETVFEIIITLSEI